MKIINLKGGYWHPPHTKYQRKVDLNKTFIKRVPRKLKKAYKSLGVTILIDNKDRPGISDSSFFITMTNGNSSRR